jgi:hypothetical protein
MGSLVLIAAVLAPLTQPDAGAPSPPSPAPIARRSDADLQAQLDRLARSPLPERIAFWSADFLGTPYGSPGQDEPAPAGLWFARVDCETFVEQVLALSVSRSLPQAEALLTRIRYLEGEARPDRRHFTVVNGWLRNAEQLGLVADVTRTLGGTAVKVATKDLTPTPEWRSGYRDRVTQLGPLAPGGLASIRYLPLREASMRARSIPHGTLVHLVSAPHPRSPYLVTHVGFALRVAGDVIFRHASQSPHRRRVEDRHLASYLHYVGRTPAGPEMRTAMGVHLSVVKER